MNNNKVIVRAAILGLALGFSTQSHAGIYAQWQFNDPSETKFIAENTGQQPTGNFAEWDTGATNLATYVTSPVGGYALHFSNNGAFPRTYFGLGNLTSGFASELPESFSNAVSVAYWLRNSVNSINYNTLLAAGGNASFSGDALNHQLQWHNGTNGVHGDTPYGTRHFMNGSNGGIGDHNSSLVINAGQWYHLAWTMSLSGGSRTETFYINGSSVHSAVIPSAINFHTFAATRFGIMTSASTPSDMFDGDLDQLEIYDNTLGASQVLALFNAGPIPEPATMTLLGLGGLAVLLRRRQGRS